MKEQNKEFWSGVVMTGAIIATMVVSPLFRRYDQLVQTTRADINNDGWIETVETYKSGKVDTFYVSENTKERFYEVHVRDTSSTAH